MKIDSLRIQSCLIGLATVLIVLWAYWTTLSDVVERWIVDPQYSHGFVVPIIALWLLWMRRERYGRVSDMSPSWSGVGIVMLALMARMAAHYFYQPWLDTGSLLICLAGIAMAAGGKRALLWTGPAIPFLTFMLPLPYQFQSAFGGALQNLATNGSTYLLQTLGVAAVADGNVIALNHTKIGVVEACSGLSMLYTFFALSTAVALIAPRSLAEKILLTLSAVPIAIMANIMRITLTGLLIEQSQGELARLVFHDLAGWLMMPLAVGMLFVELFILGRSLVPVSHAMRTNRPVLAQ